MKFTIEPAPLKNLVRDLKAAAGKRTPMPIFEHVLLTAGPAGLTAYATDQALTVAAKAECKIDRQGQATVPFAMFAQLVSKMAGPVTLDTAELDTVLKAGRSKYSLRGLKPEDYPEPQLAPSGAAITLPAALLTEAIAATAWSADEAEDKITGGMLVQLQNGQLTLAATDGYRCSLWTDKQDAANFTHVVPKRTMIELQRLIKDNKPDEVRIYSLASRIGFEVGDRYMTSGILMGDYPPVGQVIPKDNPFSFDLERDELAAALDRALIVASSLEARVMRLELENGELTLTAGSAEVTEGVETLAIAWSHEPYRFFLNGGFLREALQALPGTQVRFEMSGALRPVKLTVPDDPRFIAVLMPLNREK